MADSSTAVTTRRARYMFAAIFVLAAAVYSFRLGHDALGASEAYSAWAAAKPSVADIVRIPVLHDPGKQIFYYATLHFFTEVIGTSEAALRSMSVIFGLLALALVYQLGREMFDESAALAAAAMWAFNPLAVVFAHRARMYSMFIAIALLQLLVLWRLRKRPSAVGALGCGVVGAALIYTHMAGILIVGAEIAMLIRDAIVGRRNQMAWLAMAVTLVLFVPYVPVARSQSQTLIEGHWLDWIGAPHVYPLAIKVAAAAAACAIGAWIVFGRQAVEQDRDEALRWLLAFAILPPLALGAGSIVIRPMYNLRYVAPATAALALIAARSFGLLSIKWRNLAAAGVAVSCLMMLPFDQPALPPWRDFARRVAADGGAGEPVFFESGFVSSGTAMETANGGFPFGYYTVPFDYYFDGRNPRVVVPGFDPASARATIEEQVQVHGGGWLITWKSRDEVKSELPDPEKFTAVEIYREPQLALYRIAPLPTPAAR